MDLTDRRLGLTPFDSFLLAGRVLLIFLFLGFIIQGTWNIARIFVSVVGLIACIMVAVGFKAKWSAAFLVLVLSVFNVFANNWWSVPSAHPQRDFLKYDFFQTLSIVGGLILLVNMGPGRSNSNPWIPLKLTSLLRWTFRGREKEDILVGHLWMVGRRYFLSLQPFVSTLALPKYSHHIYLSVAHTLPTSERVYKCVYCVLFLVATTEFLSRPLKNFKGNFYTVEVCTVEQILETSRRHTLTFT